jgi:hypothetical protein
MPKPQDKDKLIDYMATRLQSAEEAIKMCEEIIRHERLNRKTMSQDIKQKNLALREILDKEKKSLQDRVDVHIEATLQMALRERMQATESLQNTEKQLAASEKSRDDLQKQVDSLGSQCNEQQQELHTKT